MEVDRSAMSDGKMARVANAGEGEPGHHMEGAMLPGEEGARLTEKGALQLSARMNAALEHLAEHLVERGTATLDAQSALQRLNMTLVIKHCNTLGFNMSMYESA